ncbi:TRAP transporter small permease subunit [Pollutimonas bauzanensis]|uniref:TRAP transporter small permease protein n=1 Tax=Pollutimonas bauzanensis TaxID=658167 RepID=A0A1M5QFL2_9BURK|nr:TRAP transporter small permease [Pollutimonas bauzanensis]SHH13014.1 TRAP-type mannitol/chloroaromatic compound transport system, small permease component [Pollutimonas bauzanensis]
MPAKTNIAEPGGQGETLAGRVFGLMVDGMNAVGSILIFCVMFLICADVLTRNLLNQPIDGVAELVSLSVIAFVFLQLASTLRHGRMSRADMFIESLRAARPRRAAGLEALFSLCGLLVCAAIGWASWPGFWRAWMTDEFVGIQGVFTAPTWPVKGIVVLGFAITAAQYLILVVDQARTACARPGSRP